MALYGGWVVGIAMMSGNVLCALDRIDRAVVHHRDARRDNVCDDEDDERRPEGVVRRRVLSVIGRLEVIEGDRSAEHWGRDADEESEERHDRLIDGRLCGVLHHEFKGRSARAAEALTSHRDEDEAVVRDELNRTLDARKAVLEALQSEAE